MWLEFRRVLFRSQREQNCCRLNRLMCINALCFFVTSQKLLMWNKLFWSFKVQCLHTTSNVFTCVEVRKFSFPCYGPFKDGQVLYIKSCAIKQSTALKILCLIRYDKRQIEILDIYILVSNSLVIVIYYDKQK